MVIYKSDTGATKRTGHLLRPASPKSPIASASALESGEGSEEDADMNENANLDTAYFHANGDAECANLNLPEHVNPSGEQLPIAASSMIRSHSVSGDLHGVQPDPVAADILRKEPEHETFKHHLLMKQRSTEPYKFVLKCERAMCLEKALLHGIKKLYLILALQSVTQILLSIPSRENPIIIFEWKMEWFMFMQIKIQKKSFFQLLMQQHFLRTCITFLK